MHRCCTLRYIETSMLYTSMHRNIDDKNSSAEDLIQWLGKIVKYIKKSVLVSDELRKAQINKEIANGNTKIIILYVETRWNSSFYMTERFLELSPLELEMLKEMRFKINGNYHRQNFW